MPAPKWLDEREERAWRGLLNMYGELRRQVSRQLQQETGLSDADYEVLVNLSEAPRGRMRPFELGRATRWEKSRLSHHLGRMAERGLVVRESCPTDSRGTVVAITPAGRAAIKAAAPKHVDHVRALFLEPLTPAQLDALADISERVLANLSSEDPCDEEC